MQKRHMKIPLPPFPVHKNDMENFNTFLSFFFFLSNLFLSRNNSSRQDEEAPAGRETI